VMKRGVEAVMRLGVPEENYETGTGSFSDQGIVQEATKLIKQEVPDSLVIADTCLCEYTSHGHCGVIENNDVVNDASLELLARTAVSQAKAGADIITPSNMMD